MKTQALIRWTTSVLVLTGLAAASGCARTSRAAPTRAMDAAAAEQAPVPTVHPERRTLARTIEQPGQIEGCEQTPLHARIGGYVHKLHADMGDRVRKDQVLAELQVPEAVEEHNQKKAAVAQAEAELLRANRIVGAAEAALRKAEAAIRLAAASRQRAEASLVRWKAQHQRESRLMATRAIDQQSFDQTTDQLRSAEAARTEADAGVQSAEADRDESAAQLERARADVAVAEAILASAEAEERRLAALLGYARILAPLDGVVTRRSIDTGHLVQAASGQASTGLPLFVVMRTDVVRLFVNVPEADAPFIQPGMSARVVVQALQEREFAATVTRTSWALEAQTRTLRAQIDLTNADGLLRPGMYATARILVERSEVLTVPSSAVLSRDDQSFLVLVEEGLTRLTPVKLGQRQGQLTEVLRKQAQPPRSDGRRTWEAFSGNEVIIPHNAGSWTEGQLVHIRPPGERSSSAAGAE